MKMTENKEENELLNTLRDIGAAFHLAGEPSAAAEISMGHINRTYRVYYPDDTENGTDSWLFQCMNTFVFRKPEQLMENIDRVTAHIREKQPERPVLRFLFAGEGSAEKNYLIRNGEFWRVSNYISSVVFNNDLTPEIIRRAGQAFGEFQQQLSDFDAALLYETIPDFHNTAQRYRNLMDAAEKDTAGRRAETEEELSWLLSVRSRACRLVELLEKGQLPLRVTHNDTKINNVLFDKETLQPLAVVDLDTVMPGLVGSDFGDAVRFAANTAEEDCRDLSRVGIDLEIFRAVTDGFLSRTARTLTDMEIDTLADACFSLTAEEAVRFLEDYLRGDVYFKVRDAVHNLERARCQIRLAQDMLVHMDEMRDIVRTVAMQYK